MRSLIICVPVGVTVGEICSRLLEFGMQVEPQGDRIVVSREGSTAWIEVDSDGELRREYDLDEIAHISELIGDWEGFVIDYRSLSVANSVAAAVCSRWKCVVDDDNGFIGLGSDYLESQSGEDRIN
ncbi:hypothetical protein IHE56_13100 [Streptomyces sp. ID01-12c]|uniref:hypothetical protein n=1 Tax=Streptomyces caniscabiei TaxID=2746961 RepID=UPI001784371C|nr:hypothetical protein [Streptomyces caniscabiei]MBD9703017.1 hypothetical protein [Streptomyces caniscabiei]MDX3732172.1 hypothetical protein [Streptomyces caniscabiei]